MEKNNNSLLLDSISFNGKATLTAVMREKTCFVQHPEVGIEQGYFGRYTYNEEFGNYQFTPLGSAIFVKQIITNIDTMKQTLLLTFTDAHGQQYVIPFEREKLTESGVLELLAYGVQARKQTANVLIKVLENQEPDANLSYQHKQLGFGQFMGSTIFKGFEALGIHSHYQGDREVRPVGSFNAWKQLVENEVLGNTALEAVLLTALAAPIVDYLARSLSLENLVMHLVGESSCGKTTAGQLAVSCGSYPDFDKSGFTLTFADTSNSLMHSIQSSYPVLIDEGSLVRFNPTSLLYSLATGKEKGRLNADLEAQAAINFNTSIFITSEKSLLNMADSNSGLLVRNLELVGMKFTNSAESADRIKAAIRQNYGWATPKMAEWLLGNEKTGGMDLIHEFESINQAIIKKIEAEDGMNPFTNRLSKKIATIILAGKVATATLGIAFRLEDVQAFLESHLMIKDIEDASLGLRAYNHIMAAVALEPEKWGETRSLKDNILLSEQEEIRKEFLITKDKFTLLLKNGGFLEPQIVLQDLKSQGLLHAEKDRYVSNFEINHVKLKGYRLYIKSSVPKKPLAAKKVTQSTELSKIMANLKEQTIEFDEE